VGSCGPSNLVLDSPRHHHDPFRNRFGDRIALQQRKLSWATFFSMMAAPDSKFANYYHYAYTQPPVMAAMVFVALWTWVAIAIQMMQPYIDLVGGHAPAKRSILLDYTRESKFTVWISAFSNRHYAVAIVTLAAILALILQPLCASILVLKNTWWGPDSFNVTNLLSISLNQGPDYLDLTAFMSAAGYASSAVLYNFSDPSFIYDVYTLPPFEVGLQLTHRNPHR